MPSEPIVFLTLAAGREETPICTLRIRLTCGPHRQRQWLLLCSSAEGDTYKGVTFTASFGVGEPGEHLYNWSGHRTARGDTTATPTVGHDLEDHPATKVRVEEYWAGQPFYSRV